MDNQDREQAKREKEMTKEKSKGNCKKGGNHAWGDYADMNPNIDVDIDKYQCKKCRTVKEE